MKAWVTRLLALALLGPIGAPLQALAQVSTVTESHRIGSLGHYEARYGTPVFVSLEKLVSGDVDPGIAGGAIRTRGFLNVGKRDTTTGRPPGFSLATGRDSLAPGSIPVYPVAEIAKEFLFEADGLKLRELEMVGTFGRVGFDATNPSIPGGLLFWIYETAEPGSGAKTTTACSGAVSGPRSVRGGGLQGVTRRRLGDQGRVVLDLGHGPQAPGQGMESRPDQPRRCVARRPWRFRSRRRGRSR